MTTVGELVEKWRGAANRMRKRRRARPKEYTQIESAMSSEVERQLLECADELENALAERGV